MKSISFCTTCKGRLWQLEQTLIQNINIIENVENVDIILLDYHSEDGLKEYIFNNFYNHLRSGKLKYYSLLSKAEYFNMSYAKNIVHCLSNSDVLFNLDADNFIGSTVNELKELRVGDFLMPPYIPNTETGTCGRIGVPRETFHLLHGYNESILGMGNDDGDFIRRLLLNKNKPVRSKDINLPINNTIEDKLKYTNPLLDNDNNFKEVVNLSGYGVAIVRNYLGEIIHTGIKL